MMADRRNHGATGGVKSRESRSPAPGGGEASRPPGCYTELTSKDQGLRSLDTGMPSHSACSKICGLRPVKARRAGLDSSLAVDAIMAWFRSRQIILAGSMVGAAVLGILSAGSWTAGA